MALLSARPSSVRHAFRPAARFQMHLLAAVAALTLAGCGGSSSPAPTPSAPAAATPTFSPSGGTFTAAQTVTLSDATAGATILYSTNGSTPSTTYTAPITVSTTETITAVATALNYSQSAAGTATYTINLPAAATPTFTPAPGAYTGVQTVTLADATSGATILYSTNGSTPTTPYTSPITVPSTETITAIATATGYSQSATASGTYTITLPAAATPAFSPAPGTYTAPQTVTITDTTPGASILYSTNGGTPTTPYTGAITVSATETITAIATATGYNTSATGSGAYTINLPAAATPTFSPVAGIYTSIQTISILDATSGAQIHYTTNGTAPTASSALYTAPISVSASETIMAIATATNYNTSAVGSAAYTINLPAAPTPTFSPAAGTYTSAQTVTISDSAGGATIYYSTNGTTPSTLYTGAITVSATETVMAFATATGYSQSATGSAAYTINQPAAATPVFSVTPGTFTSVQTVAITDTTTGAQIYYTTNGSTPVPNAGGTSLYTGPITVSSTETLEAVATATGYNQSAVATGVYTINLPAAATPVFSPAAGTFTSIQTVSIADSTTGAQIYYTTNGSTPVPNASGTTLYTGPITVSATETIEALATATNYTTSAVATGVYTINLPAAATPTFSPAAGSYTSSQSVIIADTTTGATIYYTVDGSTPSPGVGTTAVYTTPIAVGSTETIKAIATATGYTQSTVATAAYTITITSPTVAVVLSTYNQTALLAPQSSVQFGNSAASTTQLIIDENQQFQSVEGFGAAFTDAAAINLEQVETPSTLSSTLSDLFTRTGNGIGISFMLNPIGASDMAKTIYTFDDVPAGQTDTNLASFSIAHDQTNIIPLIKAAKTLNPSMKLMASPWSPPGWMKSSISIEGGTLNTTAYTPFANYLVKYLQAYSNAGITNDYLSIQNEPLYQSTGYPTMYMDEPTALTVTRDYVLPAFTAAGITTRILLYDHNWDTPSYPASMLTDPTLLASPLIAGTAWHGYGGPPGAELGLQNQYPTKNQWETEHSGGTFVGTSAAQFIADFNEITLVMRSASKAYLKWNLALDQNSGPNTSQLGSQYSGCSTCTALIQVNSSTGVATKQIEYYTLGHFSKYVLPGAVRVWSSNTPTIVSSAYVNPDGTRALVAFNNSFSSATFQVVWGTQNFSYTLAAYSAATFVWSGTQTGTPTQSATQQIQGDSFNSATGLEVEETTDTTGSYDLGYVVDGATAYYKNVSFPSTGVSQVSVRVASGGSGGTVEFHLDSATGTLLGKATLPVTGGYQTWQTVNTPVASATGTHDVYMVIHGSGGIGNVNWFQFQ